MLTIRDRNILKFIETHGGITINQVALIFYNKTKHGYDLARKRMKKICEMVSNLSYFTNSITGERVYYENKKISPHSVYVLDFYAKLLSLDCKVLEFKKEPRWMDGEYRSDAFFKIEYNGQKRILCLEVNVMHSANLDKYERIYDSKEFQKIYGGDIFPLIVVVDDAKVNYHNDKFTCVFLDYNLNNIVEKVLVV